METYLFLTTGFEETEVITTVDILRRAGVKLSIVSLTYELGVTGAHDISIKADMLWSEVKKESRYAILPGGMPGTTNLLQHKGLRTWLKNHAASKGKIAAICAAPQVLAAEGILQGIHATCFPGVEPLLTGAIIENRNAVEDGNIITARDAATAPLFAFMIAKNIVGLERAIAVTKAMGYPLFTE